jgi:hypothetical protein
MTPAIAVKADIQFGALSLSFSMPLALKFDSMLNRIISMRKFVSTVDIESLVMRYYIIFVTFLTSIALILFDKNRWIFFS